MGHETIRFSEIDATRGVVQQPILVNPIGVIHDPGDDDYYYFIDDNDYYFDDFD